MRYKLLLILLILIPTLIQGASTINPLTKPRADTLYCPISGGCAGVSGDRWLTDGFYLYNNSNTVFFNETLLNITIDDRVTITSDTVWDHNTTTIINVSNFLTINETWFVPFIQSYDTDTTCNGETCSIANTGTLDGYEASELLGSGGGLNISQIQNITFGLIVGSTAGTYSGNLSNSTHIGYERGHALCLSEHGGHYCQEAEILKSNELGTYHELGDTYWYAVGAPGFTAEANSCGGATDDNSLSLGSFWRYNLGGVGQGKLTNCAQTKALLCCG